MIDSLQSGGKADENIINFIFNELDKDKNQKISVEEFVEGYFI